MSPTAGLAQDDFTLLKEVSSMKVLWLLMTCALVAGCASTMQARSDYDSSQSFSGYRLFAWMDADPLIAPAGGTSSISPLNRRRIVEAIETELGARGFQKTSDREAADFVVSYTAGARDRLDVQSYPAPYRGYWRWGHPYFGRDVDVEMYREGTLAIDIFDGKTRQPVWHGWATKRVTDADVRAAAEQIPLAVSAILEDFPPRSRKP
jgi:hypothetical protein